jgi:hypothetical protein
MDSLDAYRYLTQVASDSGWQAGSAGTTTATLSGWQDAAMQQQQAYQYQYYAQVPTWTNSMANAIRKIKFWRVNQLVEMDEGSTYQDPLDELRLKIARWLRPKEACNYA